MVFTGNTAGYVGYFGPTPGETLVAVGFARANTPDLAGMSAAIIQAQNSVGIGGTTVSVDTGFLCDYYAIDWRRNTQIKHFFNNAKPAVMTGYGQGSVTFRGLIGTYDGINFLINANQQYDDICEPLVAVIGNANQLKKCVSGGTTREVKGVEHRLYGLVLNDYQITGQIEDSGLLLQQATLVYTIGALDAAEVTL